MGIFKLAPACRFSWCQALLLHGQEIPNLDPYVKLARQRLQPAVTVAMQIDPALAHIPPGPEWVVAQDKVHAIDTQLGIWLDALPAIAANDRGIVIVASDKVFTAVQRLDESCYALWPLANGEVTEVPDLIVRSNHRIPPIDHLEVHLGNGRKRSAVKAQRACMAKMMVTREIDRHRLLPGSLNGYRSSTCSAAFI
jgi:hypothetical protein